MNDSEWDKQRERAVLAAFKAGRPVFADSDGAFHYADGTQEPVASAAGPPKKDLHAQLRAEVQEIREAAIVRQESRRTVAALPDGAVITTVHLTDEQRSGISTGGAVILAPCAQERLARDGLWLDGTMIMGCGLIGLFVGGGVLGVVAGLVGGCAGVWERRRSVRRWAKTGGA